MENIDDFDSIQKLLLNEIKEAFEFKLDPNLIIVGGNSIFVNYNYFRFYFRYVIDDISSPIFLRIMRNKDDNIKVNIDFHHWYVKEYFSTQEKKKLLLLMKLRKQNIKDILKCKSLRYLVC